MKFILHLNKILQLRNYNNIISKFRRMQMFNKKIYTKIICVSIFIFSIIGIIKYNNLIDNNHYIETINVFENNKS